MNATDVVGYAYEADVHCLACTEKRFSGAPGRGHALATTELHDTDEEGNEITPIFAGEDAMEDCDECGGSGECVVECKRCGGEIEHDCYPCEGKGKVSRRCGNCGKELIS